MPPTRASTTRAGSGATITNTARTAAAIVTSLTTTRSGTMRLLNTFRTSVFTLRNSSAEFCWRCHDHGRLKYACRRRLDCST